jgi:tetratricopeptide (TPR) repeat protein
MTSGAGQGEHQVTQPTIIAENAAPAESTAPNVNSAECSAGHVASDVRKDLATINARIADIEAFQQRKGPWYRDTSLLIAGAAFFVSLATSGISAYRTYKQDINSREDALHGIIQQFYATTLSNLATQFSFQKDANGPTDPGYSKSQLFSNAAQQIVGNANQAFAKQGLSLVNELGRNASAIDLTETGILLAGVNQFNSAEDLYNRALNVAVNSIEYLGAARSLAQQQYYLGRKEDATVNIKKALGVFSKFPNEANSPDYVNYSMAQTYLYWAQFVGVTDCKLSNENISQAVRYAGLLTPIVHQGSGIEQQISTTRTALASCDTSR